MSMGSLVPQDSPIAWRGLMVQKALNQLLFEVAWPKLDLLVLDLPPGTGDVQLTITQSIELSGRLNRLVTKDLILTDIRCHNRIYTARSSPPRRHQRRRSL